MISANNRLSATKIWLSLSDKRRKTGSPATDAANNRGTACIIFHHDVIWIESEVTQWIIMIPKHLIRVANFSNSFIFGLWNIFVFFVSRKLTEVLFLTYDKFIYYLDLMIVLRGTKFWTGLVPRFSISVEIIIIELWQWSKWLLMTQILALEWTFIDGISQKTGLVVLLTSFSICQLPWHCNPLVLMVLFSVTTATNRRACIFKCFLLLMSEIDLLHWNRVKMF